MSKSTVESFWSNRLLTGDSDFKFPRNPLHLFLWNGKKKRIVFWRDCRYFKTCTSEYFHKEFTQRAMLVLVDDKLCFFSMCVNCWCDRNRSIITYNCVLPSQGEFRKSYFSPLLRAPHYSAVLLLRLHDNTSIWTNTRNTGNRVMYPFTWVWLQNAFQWTILSLPCVSGNDRWEVNILESTLCFREW